METKKTTFDSYQGNKKELHLCSPGLKVVIREITGEDEDTLTLVKEQEDGSAVNNFVASVIEDASITADVVNSWRTRDKYLVLFETIRLSYGDMLEFEHKFKDGTVQRFEEDLSQFVWDFSEKGLKSYPYKGDKGYFDQRIVPYPNNDPKVVFKLASGKEVGFYYLTGEMESVSLMADESERSINDDLRDRRFFQVIEKQEQPIGSFRVFSGREMREIRSVVSKTDEAWPALVDLKHPHKANTYETVSLFRTPDFFFPRLF